jgi:hypothetical protein
MGLVVANDVFLEDGDVAVSGLDVHMSEEGGPDLDRQTVADEVSGEKPAEVVK